MTIARTTTVRRHVAASPLAVFRALTNDAAVREWKFPDGMRITVHEFAAHEGGRFRISLTYVDGVEKGKTDARTDTYRGHFVRLVPGQEVVEELAFETDDPALQGTMRITYSLNVVGGGTELLARHEGIPPGVPLAQNELGWLMALARLARLVEGEPGPDVASQRR